MLDMLPSFQYGGKTVLSLKILEVLPYDGSLVQPCKIKALNCQKE